MADVSLGHMDGWEVEDRIKTGSIISRLSEVIPDQVKLLALLCSASVLVLVSSPEE
jgi:hypothetical protein